MSDIFTDLLGEDADTSPTRYESDDAQRHSPTLQTHIHQVLQNIARNWDVLAAIEAFAIDMLQPHSAGPDGKPIDGDDTQELGISILGWLEALAERTYGEPDVAMTYIVQSIRERIQRGEGEKGAFVTESDLQQAFEAAKRRSEEREGKGKGKKRPEPGETDFGDDDDNNNDDDDDAAGGGAVEKYLDDPIWNLDDTVPEGWLRPDSHPSSPRTTSPIYSHPDEEIRHTSPDTLTFRTPTQSIEDPVLGNSKSTSDATSRLAKRIIASEEARSGLSAAPAAHRGYPLVLRSASSSSSSLSSAPSELAHRSASRSVSSSSTTTLSSAHRPRRRRSLGSLSFRPTTRTQDSDSNDASYDFRHERMAPRPRKVRASRKPKPKPKQTQEEKERSASDDDLGHELIVAGPESPPSSSGSSSSSSSSSSSEHSLIAGGRGFHEYRIELPALLYTGPVTRRRSSQATETGESNKRKMGSADDAVDLDGDEKVGAMAGRRRSVRVAKRIKVKVGENVVIDAE